MLSSEKAKILKELFGEEGVEIVMVNSFEEGIEKVRELLDKHGMSDKDKDELVDTLLNSVSSVDKYVTVGSTITKILMSSEVPREVAVGGCLTVASNCALVDYADELKATKPCEIDKVRDENLIPLIMELSEKIKPILDTAPTNKVVAALTGIALNALCKEEELAKKVKNKDTNAVNKMSTEEAIKKALECLANGNALEAQGILNTIANIKK